jgi:prophage maintenance system killer protein
VIISVGYRVNSARATQFRVWATNVLRKHLVDGYTFNEKRLRLVEHKYIELRKSVSLLENVLSLEGVAEETKGLIQVISSYSRALDILDDHDHERLSSPEGTTRIRFEMSYDEAHRIIETMRGKFGGSGFFGREKDISFKSSLNAVNQTFGGKDLYPTVELKAAHLLYFVTKNHSFVDGNKRIAAALFICFLQKNRLLLRKDGARCIDDNALVALTLLVASSRPAEKESIIRVILNLLCS